MSTKYLGGKGKGLIMCLGNLVKEGLAFLFYFCQSGKYYNLISVVSICLFPDMFLQKRVGNLDTSILLHQSLFTGKFNFFDVMYHYGVNVGSQLPT